MLSLLLHKMNLNSLWTKECNLSKSMNCKTGSTRNEKNLRLLQQTLEQEHAHTTEELEKELVTSIVASSRIGERTPDL
jgi:hypothetical protein